MLKRLSVFAVILIHRHMHCHFTVACDAHHKFMQDETNGEFASPINTQQHWYPPFHGESAWNRNRGCRWRRRCCCTHYTMQLFFSGDVACEETQTRSLGINRGVCPTRPYKPRLMNWGITRGKTLSFRQVIGISHTQFMRAVSITTQSKSTSLSSPASIEAVCTIPIAAKDTPP